MAEVLEGDIFKTCKGHIIPLENIDFVDRLEYGEIWDDNYKIHMKSGNTVLVSAGRDYRMLKEDRDKLIDALSQFINQNNSK